MTAAGAAAAAIEIVRTGDAPFRVASVRWCPAEGRHGATLVVKLTYDLRPGTSPLARRPEPIAVADRHEGGRRSASVRVPSDIAPFKRHAEVILVGRAFAPEGQRAKELIARLVVGSVDKSISVHPALQRTPNGELAPAATWTSAPLSYEHAAGGPGTHNPVGVPAGPAELGETGRRALPRLRTPGATWSLDAPPIEPVGFGPLSASWPERRSKLGAHAAEWVERMAKRPLPSDLDLTYFQVAPADQRLEELRSDERIVLENLHPQHARLVTNLPGVAPTAYAEHEGSARTAVELVADTLWIDTERALCTVCWRGFAPLPSATTPVRFVVSADDGTNVTTDDEIELDEREDTFTQTVNLPASSIGLHGLPFTPPGRVVTGEAPEKASEPERSRPIALAPPPATFLATPKPASPPPAKLPDEQLRRAAYAGVLEASNAATHGHPTDEVASADLDDDPSPEAGGDLLELIWFDPDAVNRLTAHPPWRPVLPKPIAPVRIRREVPSLPSDAPPSPPAPRDVVSAILARAPRTAAADLGHLMRASRSAGALLTPALCLIDGRCELPFDEVEALKATARAAAPSAKSDKALRGLLDLVEELLALPLEGAPGVADSFTRKIQHQWAETNRILPGSFLTANTERVLLEGRHYQTRDLLDGCFLRALWTSGDTTLVAYLPELLKRKLPLFPAFDARAIAEVLPRQDQAERGAIAVRVIALARRIDGDALEDGGSQTL